ncbi:MAG: DUF2911 domain-containing protein [Cyclobacteriaceae bacterium]|jgi:hypothetical protein|nr:DUF2911 domain-containing protein [Cyclobacteriaceae bacterium]
MIKKIGICIGILAVVLLAAFLYLNYRNRTLSPPGSASIENSDLKVSISYSRPSVRGRLIFGDKSLGALQPNNEYWRLGANESTEITFNKDVKVNGLPLKAGTYRLYAMPKEDGFDIIANSELGRWGAFEPNHKADVLTTFIKYTKPTAPVEQFTIMLANEDAGVNVVFSWSDREWTLPITL